MGLINIEDVSDISKYNIKISSLDEISTSMATNVFIGSRKITDSDRSMFKISYDNLLSNLIDDLKCFDLNGISGKWIFGKNNNSTLKIDTRAIAGKSNNTVINAEYLSSNIISKIYELSSEIYANSHMPSNVGDVIFSYTLSSKEEVKKIYGQNTDWQQIEKKSIIGVGAVEENSIAKYGITTEGLYTVENNSDKINNMPGQIEFLINENQLPTHSHAFKADAAKFNLSWRIGITYVRGLNGGGHDDLTKLNAYTMYQGHRAPWASGADSTHYQAVGAHGSEGIAGSSSEKDPTTSLPTSVPCSGEKELKMSNYRKKDGISIDKSIYDANTGKIVNQKKHQNMPPYFVAYIWERIS